MDMVGTQTLAAGLPCVPGPGLEVSVGAGRIYAVAPIDATPYSSLPANANLIVKQGLNFTAVLLNCPAPTSGSVNYLIEATYADADTSLTTLPYYNASNPSQAYAGPLNNGQAQATVRQGQVALKAKAGVPAASGSQVTPGADAGYIGLYAVTVSAGQSQIVAANIVPITTSILLPGPYLPLTGGTLSGQLNIAGADLHVYRAGGTTGAIFFNAAANVYLYYDGVNFDFSAPGSVGLTFNGTVLASTANVAAAQAAAISTSESYTNTVVAGLATTASVTAGVAAAEAYTNAVAAPLATAASVTAGVTAAEAYAASVANTAATNAEAYAVAQDVTNLAAAKTYANGTSSLAANGWTMLPNGLILQWGQMAGQATNSPVVTMSRSFPTVCYSVTVTTISPTVGNASITNVAALPAAGALSFTLNTSTKSSGASWFAIGR